MSRRLVAALAVRLGEPIPGKKAGEEPRPGLCRILMRAGILSTSGGGEASTSVTLPLARRLARPTHRREDPHPSVLRLRFPVDRLDCQPRESQGCDTPTSAGPRCPSSPSPLASSVPALLPRCHTSHTRAAALTHLEQGSSSALPRRQQLRCDPDTALPIGTRPSTEHRARDHESLPRPRQNTPTKAQE
jgi:hypothetical protein